MSSLYTGICVLRDLEGRILGIKVLDRTGDSDLASVLAPRDYRRRGIFPPLETLPDEDRNEVHRGPGGTGQGSTRSMS